MARNRRSSGIRTTLQTSRRPTPSTFTCAPAGEPPTPLGERVTEGGRPLAARVPRKSSPPYSDSQRISPGRARADRSRCRDRRAGHRLHETLFRVGSHFDDWERLQNRVLKTAVRSGDRHSTAKIHRCLGELTAILDRYPEALIHFEQTLSLAEGQGPNSARVRASGTAGRKRRCCAGREGKGDRHNPPDACGCPASGTPAPARPLRVAGREDGSARCPFYLARERASDGRPTPRWLKDKTRSCA